MAVPKILGLSELHAKMGRGRAPHTFRVWVWRQVRAGAFPAPIQIGPRSIGWVEAEVEAALAAAPRVTYAPADRRAA